MALASALVSGVFAAFVLATWARKRRRYQALWGIGLAMFSTAATAGWLAQASGATELEYRLFYLLGAILNVAWLALGTIALLARPRVTDVAIAVVAVFSLVATGAVFASPVDLTAAMDTGRGFHGSPLPRILAGIGSGGGTIVLGGGALWSGWLFWRRGGHARRALANVVIAAGVFIAAAGGTAAFTGASGIVEATNLIAASVMFVGFRLAS
ncbi:MAG: hypothetical protein FJ034_05455 [Chloroflexi bacterium]|nr:hypothetical protein [Chloroflexota bacterium]